MRNVAPGTSSEWNRGYLWGGGWEPVELREEKESEAKQPLGLSADANADYLSAAPFVGVRSREIPGPKLPGEAVLVQVSANSQSPHPQPCGCFAVDTFRHRPPSQTTALRRFFPIASRSLLAPPLLPLCSSDESSRSVCLSAQPPLTLSSPSAAASFAAAKAAALQAQLSQLSATLSLHKDSGIAALLCARERLLSSHFAQSLSKEYKQALVALSEASPLGLTFTVVAVLSGLALGTFAMRRFFGLDEPQSGRTSSPSSSSLFADASKPDHVLVKHGKQFLRVDFSKPGDISKGIATVGDVRATTARFLGVPKNDVILVYSGKKLRDDKDTLASHKMMSGSRMMCLVSSVQNAPPAAPARPMPQKPKKPTDPIEQINLVMDSAAKELVPMIDAFVAAPPNDHGDKHRMLSELILQRLFALDEVDTHENPEARKRRKEAVNKFHEYQARVDEANVGE